MKAVSVSLTNGEICALGLGLGFLLMMLNVLCTSHSYIPKIPVLLKHRVVFDSYIRKLDLEIKKTL